MDAWCGLRWLLLVAAATALDPDASISRLAANAGACERTPSGVTAPKSNGTNGFEIRISGNPEKYVPGEGYTVSLQGIKTPSSVQKFIDFTLVVEPKHRLLDDAPAHQNVGYFQLYGDALSKFSETCLNAIVQASNIAKSEIQVVWRAPPAGSGCVVFKATVVELKDVWYMDSGGLIKELCEEEQESQDEQPEVLDECCACDEAKYEMTFEGLWSRHTHPKGFPNGQLTHFSDIIGASHAGYFRIWEYGGYASDGVKQVAEMGSTRNLESELKTESDKIRTIIKARGLFFPNVTSRTFAVFRVDRKHHVMSMLSMLGPSPDWFVGVSALELCLRNCSWLSEKVMNLYPWDAGTDSGVTYVAPNAPTIPQEKIRRITSTFPVGDDSPFYDPSSLPMKPVARLTVTRQRVYEKSCDDVLPEPQEPGKAECAVTEWTDFNPCSVTCGQGVRMRTRTYISEHKARGAGCVVQLVEKEDCEATCIGSVSCETTPWSDWSACSVTCGKGTRVRKRKYKNHKARKLCSLSLENKDPCMASTPECPESEVINPQCAVTQWSEWSPCTVTCGKGMQVRTRLYLNPAALSVCNVELMQKSPCMASKVDCSLDLERAKEVCMKPKEVGPCRGYFPRWYFHATRGICLQFIYGGCRGNENNFVRYSDCNRMCEEMLKAPLDPLPSTAQPLNHSDQPVIDCVVTPWSEWTPCSRTCNSGRKERRRMIKLNPQNGGKTCPRKLVQRRKCKDNPPCHCSLSTWSEWSPCSKTCGSEAIQQRSRHPKRPTNGKCEAKVERRYCSLEDCPPY